MTVTYLSEMTVDLVDYAGSDLSIVKAARVSIRGDETEDQKALADRDTGLINFLMKNRHGTPFEHNSLTFFIKAPIAVFRELFRHRIASINEESGRYKVLKGEFYIPPRHRPFVQEGKPGAYEFVDGTDEQYEFLVSEHAHQFATAYASYERQLEKGIAKEVARGVLPVYIFSSCYWTVNARSLMNVLSLRTLQKEAYIFWDDKRHDLDKRRELVELTGATHEDIPGYPGSQFPSFPMWEIEQVATKVEASFAKKFPITHKTFCQNGRVAP